MANRHTTLTSLFDDVADAIREKTGSNEAIKADDFDTAIAAIPTGGGGVDPEDLAFTGVLNYWSGKGAWSNLIHKNLDNITFTNVTEAQNMFESYNYGDDLSVLEIKFNNSSGAAVQSMFQNSKMYKCPIITNMVANRSGTYNMFKNCDNLNSLPSNFDINMSNINTYKSGNCGSMFDFCYSLRSVPQSFVNKCYSTSTTANSQLLKNAFQNCYALDTIYFPAPPVDFTSNMFSFVGQGNHNLKHIIFATDNGTPYVRNWSNQNIVFYGEGIGYTGNSRYKITEYAQYSGIDVNKEIKDAESYALYKNDPNAWVSSTDLIGDEWSWFGHDSFVEFLRSLPDVSSGSNNTITNVDGNLGKRTDQGAISTITDEEIAIATNKGWTISFA